MDESSDEPRRDLNAAVDARVSNGFDSQFVPHDASRSEDITHLRGELSRLQEQVEILQQQRDDAAEQAGTLRLDRDRLYGSLARLEVRVQEIEEENRTASFSGTPNENDR